MSPNNTDNAPSIPLERLAEYMRAVDQLREGEYLTREQLLGKLDHITKVQFNHDLQILGLGDARRIPRIQLARILRRHLSQERPNYQAIELSTRGLPSPETLLKAFSGRTGHDFALRSAIIEAAHVYATESPDLFVLGHGLFASVGEVPPSERIVAYRHQVQEARRIVEEYIGNGLVVHEVGLGKTFTAILVLAELVLRDPDLTVLILVPTNLKNQWLKELKRCLELPIYAGVNAEKLAAAPYVLMSMDTAKEQHRAKLLLQRQWGLLIVDEGHLLREELTIRYRFIYAVQACHRLLLTATPVHNSPYDIFHEANLVHPGLLGRKELFAESYMIGERQLIEPVVLRERLRPIINHCQRTNTGLSFPTRDVQELEIAERSQIESQLYTDVLRVLRGIYRRHLGAATRIRRPSGNEQQVSQIVLVAILVLRELASHPLSAIHTLSGSLFEKVEKLASVTGDNTDCDELEKIIARYAKETWKTGSHTKTDALITELPKLVDAHGRVIVYVEFRETQKIIIQRLTRRREVGLAPHTELISFHGGLSEVEKNRQIERFEENKLACFVSTDAGGQGLNLQAGHVVVNFDFPWNPMRVEQRIGRVDRLEQASDVVLVRNFITVDTIEQYVYQTLRRKFKVCEDVLGRVLPEIFNLRRGAPFSSESDILGIGHLILSSQDDNDLRLKFLAFEQSVEEQIQGQTEAWNKRRRWLNE